MTVTVYPKSMVNMVKRVHFAVANESVRLFEMWCFDVKLYESIWDKKSYFSKVIPCLLTNIKTEVLSIY